MDSLGQYDENDNIPNRVVKYLLMVKISPSLRGFDYLQTAIELCLKDGAIINHVTSELYPEVAKEFNVTGSIVERCMRTAIDNAYKNGGLLGINNFYNKVVYKNDYKLTNAELISLIVENVRLDVLKDRIERNRKDFDDKAE